MHSSYHSSYSTTCISSRAGLPYHSCRPHTLIWLCRKPSHTRPCRTSKMRILLSNEPVAEWGQHFCSDHIKPSAEVGAPYGRARPTYNEMAKSSARKVLYFIDDTFPAWGQYINKEIDKRNFASVHCGRQETHHRRYGGRGGRGVGDGGRADKLRVRRRL